MGKSRIVAASALLAATGLALTACSTSGGGGQSSDSGSAEPVTVTFRTWDQSAADAYQQSFAEFTQQNPNISVTVTVVPWADYFTKLRTDIAAGDADDLFWINSASFGPYASTGNLIDVSNALGTDAEQAWDSKVVDQFTQDGKLWGVPQTSDGGIALYYNKSLVQEAGIDDTTLSSLSWSPDGTGDTLLPTAEKLTKDSQGRTADQADFDSSDVQQWGYNAAQDLQAITLPFIGSNGGTFQDGDTFTFSNPLTEDALGYVVSLINDHHVSPSAADTNSDGSYSLNQFLQGKMALFQSGLYNLSNIATSAQFDWGVTLQPSGPAGRVSVSNGLVVAGNANSAHLDATQKVLAWLGTTEGNQYIGASGANLPAVTAAQQVYFDYWKSQGVDVSPFFDVVKDGATTIPAPVGSNFNAASTAYSKILDEVYLGRLSIDEGAPQADEAANTVVNGG